MSKIVIIGVDGLDPFLLHQWRDDLPNINRLYNELSEIVIESTFPPDSICAWASIYTGNNPAEHGLLESIDYLSKRKLVNDEDRSAYFRGKTFWDVAGKMGRTVCVINPFIAYPAWEVNGIMVSGPVFEGGQISAYPEHIIQKYKFPSLGGMVEFPEEKALGDFFIQARDLTEHLADVGLRIYKDFNIDLFFLTFLTLDRIKHFLWRFTDENDMYYPGDNIHKNAIKDFYLLFDKIIGKFMKIISGDTSLLVISDHGHRRRCQRFLNLNEILRQKGYLKTKSNGASGLIRKSVEKAKVFTIGSLSRFGFQDWIYKIAKFIPNRKELKKSTYLIDEKKSLVTLSNLCGANPYGGIDVKGEKTAEYERLRDRTMNDLMELNKTFGRTVFKWVKKREEIYSGKYENRLPDVLFELEDEYGIGMDFFAPDIIPNYSHTKISGGHKREAVLLIKKNNDTIKNIQKPISILGLKSYILKIIESS